MATPMADTNMNLDHDSGISIEFPSRTVPLEGSTSIDGVRQRKKTPKRILHFSDGVLEEYSTDEDEIDSPKSCNAVVDTKTMPWIPFIMHMVLQMGAKTIQVCDYFGENLAYFFGITSPKFEYEIEEFKKMEEEEAEIAKKEGEDNAGWIDDSGELGNIVHTAPPPSTDKAAAVAMETAPVAMPTVAKDTVAMGDSKFSSLSSSGNEKPRF